MGSAASDGKRRRPRHRHLDYTATHYVTAAVVTRSCIALWWCCTERNIIREGEQRRDPAGLVHSIQATAEEWRRPQRSPAVPRPCRVRKWEIPKGDLVKVKCDAAYDPGTGNGGWGCILRDPLGDVVTALRRRTEALMNALHGELVACIQGT